MPKYPAYPNPDTLLAIVGITAAAVIFLALQGRVWWQAGDYSPWDWDIWSTHNSSTSSTHTPHA